MNHSVIIQELLHKLSKNELLLQDGGNSRNSRNSVNNGNQKYYNRTNQYRNQLNSMYGSGAAEDRMTEGIIADIDTLVPLSVLEQFVAKAESEMNRLREREKTLNETIERLTADASTHGDTSKRVAELTAELSKVQQYMTELSAKLEATESQLQDKLQEISKLKQNISDISTRVTNVKKQTVDSNSNSDAVRQLFARLNSPGTAAASTTGPASGSPPGS
jgi:chromosome segregation ATPase